MEGKFKISSYNCRGHGKDRIEYIKNLMSDCDFLFLQEHWYLDENISQLESQLDGMNCYGVSGVEKNELLYGRPYGGCAFIYPKTLKCTLKPLPSSSKRICACMLNLTNDNNFLLINVYMPCDSRGANDIVYNDVLSEISELIACHSTVNQVIIGGDFNTDIRRQNSCNTKALLEFCELECLKLCIQSNNSLVDYTYESNINNSNSIIDHFIVSDNLYMGIEEYESVHDGDNLSDHCPLLLKMNMSVNHGQSQERRYTRRFAWNKATPTEIKLYKETMAEMLKDVVLPIEALSCYDHNCIEHYDCINKYHDDLMKVCIDSAKASIPVSGPRRIAKWSEIVGPYKEQSIFWHRMWIDNGRPQDGLIYDIMRKCKLEYKRISRWVMRNKDKLTADRMAESLRINQRDFWAD